MSAEDRAAVKGGLTDAQFDALLRAVRETVRAEIRAEFEGRREAASEPWVDTRGLSSADAAVEMARMSQAFAPMFGKR